LEVGTGQSFPQVVNRGNGSDSHSLGSIHSLQVALCLVPKEWPRVGNGPGSTMRGRHSLGQIHSLQVTLCLVSEEWPRVRNGPGSEIRTIILSVQVDDCYEDCMTADAYYCGGCVPLFDQVLVCYLVW
jgi:hypothetical protein